MTESIGNEIAEKEFLGHPRGLVICFLTEMWERFSYYGMRALLIFYLTQHFLFSDQSASSIYAAYISLVYITPVIGGVVADRYLGPVKAVILGAILLVAGHTGMAIEGAQAVEITVAGQRVIERDPFYLQVFYFSLGLIIMGVGFLKANISTLVGSMYDRQDPRRDGAFTLFYMGINAGSFLGAIICGLLLQYGGFSWGFGAAGVGMLFGLFVFLKGYHLFGSAGAPKDPVALQQKILPGLSRESVIYILAFLGVLICWQLMQTPVLVGGLVGATLVIMTLIVVFYAFTKCEPVDRNRMLVCLFLMSYQIIFWSLWEQTGSSLNLMADRNVDRVILGIELPAAIFQSVNAFFIITLAPVFQYRLALSEQTRLGTQHTHQVRPGTYTTRLRFSVPGIWSIHCNRSNSDRSYLADIALSSAYNGRALYIPRWAFNDYQTIGTKCRWYDDGLLVSRHGWW